jgi:uncharacterized membrane protein YhhN
MLTDVLSWGVVVATVVVLLYGIRVGHRGLEVSSKFVASAGFVTLGCLRWGPGDTVGAWLVAGLVLCAGGDVLLLRDRTFDAGLLVFLLGHLAYVGSFRAALPLSTWPLAVALLLVVAGAGAIRWLWPHLGRRRVPVLLYIVAISVMVWGAVSTLLRGALPWTATCGAVLFYLSDLAVARHRFVRRSFLNRALGLPAYYVAQLLLAGTIGGGHS